MWVKLGVPRSTNSLYYRPMSGVSTAGRRAPANGTRRRKRGSGGVTFVRDGVWRIDVEIGRDSVTGKRRRVSRTVEGTARDAEVALARLKVADHERRLHSGGTRAHSVGAALDQYLEAIDHGLIELAPSTVLTSRSAIRTMKAIEMPDGRLFGNVRLSRLGWQDIEHLYAGMSASGRGADWTRRCATVLSRSLELARKRGMLDSNPAKDASRPKTTRTKPYSPTFADVRQLLSDVALVDPELADAAIILASTGIRRGELLGLQWNDVDLRANEIHVAFAVTDGGPGVGLVRKVTKRSDWRDVPLTGSAVAAFEAQRVRLADRLVRSLEPHDYVFPSAATGGMPLRPETLTGRWASSRGASPITLLHLRHFAATSMLDAGESYRTVADILGNSEATLRLHYDGRTDAGKRKAIAALELG